MEAPLLLNFLLGVLLAAGLVFLFCALRQRRLYAALLFAQGLSYIKMLRGLLMLVQQHRGFSTGFINGNAAAKADIELLARRIKRSIAELDASGEWLHGNVKWRSLLDHWSRLSGLYLQGDAEKNFRQHNILIANLLYLIDDLADVHGLTKLTGDAMDTDWRYLLSIAEYIGQVRALGTGVAAKGQCSNVLRVQLNHLRNKIASSVDASWPEPVRADISLLLETIETRLLADYPSITARDYFALATRCIDHVLDQFDRQIDRLEYSRH